MTKICSRLENILNTSKKIEIDESSKIVIMTDCHRGDANWSDDFARNQNEYLHALQHYYEKGYTYIELGDGDDLWENKSFEDIASSHNNTFRILAKMYKVGRFHTIYGNHDMVKKYDNYRKKNMQTYLNDRKRKEEELFPNIQIEEGLVLHYKPLDKEILLIHGHQGDLMNDKLWKLGRFLVRYIWRPLEIFGVKDPTRAAKNYHKKINHERKLIRWLEKTDRMLIAGHTHRPVFPEVGDPLYLNGGSCVHPRCITCIEICDGKISLIKWHIETNHNGVLYVAKDILAGKVALGEIFNYPLRDFKINRP